MNKQELIALIAEEHNMTKVKAHRIVDSIFDNIVKAVARGETFQAIGLGTFKAVKRDAHQSRNPRTGETIQVTAKVVPKFAPGKAFKNATK